MTKPFSEFSPTHYLMVDNYITLQIELVKDNGELFVYGAYYNELTRTLDKVTKSVVRSNFRGHSFFIKNHQRYYLADFTKKSPF